MVLESETAETLALAPFVIIVFAVAILTTGLIINQINNSLDISYGNALMHVTMKNLINNPGYPVNDPIILNGVALSQHVEIDARNLNFKLNAYRTLYGVIDYRKVEKLSMMSYPEFKNSIGLDPSFDLGLAVHGIALGLPSPDIMRFVRVDEFGGFSHMGLHGFTPLAVLGFTAFEISDGNDKLAYILMGTLDGSIEKKYVANDKCIVQTSADTVYNKFGKFYTVGAGSQDAESLEPSGAVLRYSLVPRGVRGVSVFVHEVVNNMNAFNSIFGAGNSVNFFAVIYNAEYVRVSGTYKHYTSGSYVTVYNLPPVDLRLVVGLTNVYGVRVTSATVYYTVQLGELRPLSGAVDIDPNTGYAVARIVPPKSEWLKIYDFVRARKDPVIPVRVTLFIKYSVYGRFYYKAIHYTTRVCVYRVYMGKKQDVNVNINGHTVRGVSLVVKTKGVLVNYKDDPGFVIGDVNDLVRHMPGKVYYFENIIYNVTGS